MSTCPRCLGAGYVCKNCQHSPVWIKNEIIDRWVCGICGFQVKLARYPFKSGNILKSQSGFHVVKDPLEIIRRRNETIPAYSIGSNRPVTFQQSISHNFIPCPECGGASIGGMSIGGQQQTQQDLQSQLQSALGPLGMVLGIAGFSLAAVAIFMVKNPNHALSAKVRQVLRSMNINVEEFLGQYLPEEMKGKIADAFGSGTIPQAFCYNCGKRYAESIQQCTDCGETIGQAYCYECNQEVDWGNEFCPLCNKQMIYQSRTAVQEAVEKRDRMKGTAFEEVGNEPVAQMINSMFLTSDKDGLYTFSSIPEKVRTACASYADIQQDEKIFMLYDTTIMRNGGTGAVFTDKGIYFMNYGDNTKQAIRYDQITSIESKKGSLLSASWIKFNGTNVLNFNNVKIFETTDRMIRTMTQPQGTVPTLRVSVPISPTPEPAPAATPPQPVIVNSMATTTVQTPAQQETIQCVSCGAQLKTTVKFCTDCGASTVQKQPESLVCSGCGAQHPLKVKFCSECGQKFE